LSSTAQVNEHAPWETGKKEVPGSTILTQCSIYRNWLSNT